jgi:hypothetical protein
MLNEALPLIPLEIFMKYRCVLLGFLAASSIGLAGCITPIDPIILESPEYKEGYVDGCTTAQNRQNGFGSKITRNEAAFDGIEAYQIGWSNGFGACGGRSADPTKYNEDQWYHQD